MRTDVDLTAAGFGTPNIVDESYEAGGGRMPHLCVKVKVNNRKGHWLKKGLGSEWERASA